MEVKQWFESRPAWLKGSGVSFVLGVLIMVVLEIIFQEAVLLARGYLFAKVGFMVYGTLLGLFFFKEKKVFGILLYLLSFALLTVYIIRNITNQNCGYFGGGCGYDFQLSVAVFIITVMTVTYLIIHSVRYYKEGHPLWYEPHLTAIVILVYGTIFSLGGLSYVGFVVVPINFLLLIGVLIQLIIHKIKLRRIN